MSQSTLALYNQKQNLVSVGKRNLTIRKYSVRTFENHLMESLSRNEWTSIEGLARLFHGRNSEEKRRQMRKQITGASKVFLERGLFLLKQKGSRGAILQVKIYSGNSIEEQQYAAKQLEDMKNRNQVTESQWKLALKIISG